MQATDSKRKRAPSKRALATRDRVLDAAEAVFAQRGFDGATIRDIAAEAGEPVGTIHHHGGGKAVLFEKVVARRAEPLSRARLEALAGIAAQDRTLETVLSAFMRPFFDLSLAEPRWRHYARLVAFVSAEDRWRDISRAHFDPTAEPFLAALATLLPNASRAEVAAGFVYSVSAMLALLTSSDRISALGAGPSDLNTQVDQMIRFCAAGLRGSSA